MELHWAGGSCAAVVVVKILKPWQRIVEVERGSLSVLFS
jgi:hypothetical protein